VCAAGALPHLQEQPWQWQLLQDSASAVVPARAIRNGRSQVPAAAT
jgi:hypothetical protein